MATQVQFRRGTSAEHAGFTGAVGEVTVDTTLDTLKVHDGATAGGIRIAKYSDIPTNYNILVEADDSAGLILTADGTSTLRFTGDQNISTSTDSAGTIIISTASTLTADLTGNVTGNVTGNSSTATALQTGRTIALSGDVAATGVTFDGTSNITLSTTIQPNSVALGTDTTGNYVASITNGNYITGGDGGSESAGLTLAVDATDANTASKVVARDGSGNFSAGTITADLTGTASLVNCTANNTTNETVYLTFVDGATGSQEIETDLNLTYNPSTNVLSTTVTEAQYADLAERYTADIEYAEGTVVVFGGPNEITQSTVENDTRIAGVISEKYAYLMNKNENGPAVALKGKVPCLVVGAVTKGDILVPSSTPGHAVASAHPNPMAVVGRSMIDDSETHPRLITIQV